MNTTFWSISIVAPVLLHCVSKKKSTERRRISEWSAEFVDTREDTNDHSRCLLENWAIASFPMAILGSVNVALRGLDIIPVANLLSFHTATCFTQLMTRLGTVAAIHQFPKYNYDLRRGRNKGPMPFLQSNQSDTRYHFLTFVLDSSPSLSAAAQIVMRRACWGLRR